MTITSPAPFPENGLRGLTPKETMQRAKALACTLPQDNKPTCSGQLFVGIFFDGTGNNRNDDYIKPPPEKRKHSNIVRLFHTFPLFKNKPGHYGIYIPGVGTPFPEIGDGGAGWSGTAGSVGAWMGEDRIVWALLQLLNAPHRYVTNDALLTQPDETKSIVCNIASSFAPGTIRRSTLNDRLDKLQAALKGRKPRIEQINLSVFGFSRGAAQARTFVNWLFEVCKQEGGGWTLAGIPLCLQFLGIFDTVASVGAANLYDSGMLAGHQSWADNTQEIHPAVEQCVHYVAGHEVRACFPLDSVRVKSTYPANAKEVMYPGAHSDVGGGYGPGALGVSPAQDSFMATIPGHNMYREALKSGVPLLPFSQLDPVFQRDLTPSADAILDFNAYRAAAKVAAGPIEEMARQHMSLYFSYRFKHRAVFDQRSPYATATEEDKAYLDRTQKALLERLGSLCFHSPSQLNGNKAAMRATGGSLDARKKAERELALARDFDPPRLAAEAEKIIRQQMFAPDKKFEIKDRHAIEVAKRIDVARLTPEIERFFDRYLHDSMAGFIGMGLNEYALNGFGFAKFRTVFKGDD